MSDEHNMTPVDAALCVADLFGRLRADLPEADQARRASAHTIIMRERKYKEDGIAHTALQLLAAEVRRLRDKLAALEACERTDHADLCRMRKERDEAREQLAALRDGFDTKVTLPGGAK